MPRRILVVNEALPDAASIFVAAGRLASVDAGSIVGLAPPYAVSVADWATWAGLPVQVLPVTYLDAPTVLTIAEQLGIDLIVIGSGCSGDRPRHQGPTLTEGITLGTISPVLLLREGVGLRLPQASNPFHTLVTVDGSTVAEGILAVAATLTTALAGEVGGEVHLMQVLHGVYGAVPAHRETMLPPDAQARWYLDQMAGRLRTLLPPHVSVSSHIQPASDVTEALLQELGIYPRTDGAAVRPWDLLAMGVLGPTGHEPHDQSSVVNHVLHATTLPMLVQCQRTAPTPAPIFLEEVIG